MYFNFWSNDAATCTKVLNLNFTQIPYLNMLLQVAIRITQTVQIV